MHTFVHNHTHTYLQIDKVLYVTGFKIWTATVSEDQVNNNQSIILNREPFLEVASLTKALKPPHKIFTT